MWRGAEARDGRLLVHRTLYDRSSIPLARPPNTSHHRFMRRCKTVRRAACRARKRCPRSPAWCRTLRAAATRPGTTRNHRAPLLSAALRSRAPRLLRVCGVVWGVHRQLMSGLGCPRESADAHSSIRSYDWRTRPRRHACRGVRALSAIAFMYILTHPPHGQGSRRSRIRPCAKPMYGGDTYMHKTVLGRLRALTCSRAVE